MDSDWARHIVIGLISALGVFALTLWGSKSPPDRQGWRSIKPGTTYGVAIGGGTIFTLFLAYIWLFVGSSRPDGEQQMRILFWLIIAFGSGTLITLFQYAQARRPAIRWRGDMLVWRGRGNVEESRKLSDAIALHRAFAGPVHIVFSDGAKLRIDPYATNALLLLETLGKRLNPEEEP
jgi:hypothetical protein